MSSWTNSPVIYLFFSKHVCATECMTYLIQEPVRLFFIIPVEVLALTGLAKKVSMFTVLLENNKELQMQQKDAFLSFEV